MSEPPTTPKDPAPVEAVADASTLEKADAAVAQAVVPYKETAPVRALSAFSKLGDQPPMRVIFAAVVVAGLLTGDSRLVRTGVRMIAAHTVATMVKNAIKNRVDRTRPELLVRQGYYRMEPGESEAREETSFPSGHSAGAVAVGRAVAREYPDHGGSDCAGADFPGAPTIRPMLGSKA